MHNCRITGSDLDPDSYADFIYCNLDNTSGAAPGTLPRADPPTPAAVRLLGLSFGGPTILACSRKPSSRSIGYIS